MLRLFSLVIFVMFGSSAYAAQMTEQQKIDGLLDAVGNSNITFIQNGEEHDGAWAKQHLAEKLKETKPAVKTADEFIRKVGSKSHEGKPYMVKTEDGKTIKSAEWLKTQLAAMAQPSAGKTAEKIKPTATPSKEDTKVEAAKPETTKEETTTEETKEGTKEGTKEDTTK